MEIQRTALEELKSKLLRRAERLERELQQIERGERIANERAYARLVDKLCILYDSNTTRTACRQPFNKLSILL
jgi:hypothetical protein